MSAFEASVQVCCPACDRVMMLRAPAGDDGQVEDDYVERAVLLHLRLACTGIYRSSATPAQPEWRDR